MTLQTARTAVWFPEWMEALRQLRLPPLRKQQYQRGVEVERTSRPFRFARNDHTGGMPVPA